MSSPNYNSNPTGNASANQSIQNRISSGLNLKYFRTGFFFLKLFTILMEIAGAISVSVVYDNWSSTRYYDFVAVTGIVLALLSILFNVLRITERFENIPWNFIELVIDALWALLILIAAAICTDWARRFSNMDSYAAAAFFGYLIMLLYIVDGFIRLTSILRRPGRSKNAKNPPSQNNQPSI